MDFGPSDVGPEQIIDDSIPTLDVGEVGGTYKIWHGVPACAGGGQNQQEEGPQNPQAGRDERGTGREGATQWWEGQMREKNKTEARRTSGSILDHNTTHKPWKLRHKANLHHT